MRCNHCKSSKARKHFGEAFLCKSCWKKTSIEARYTAVETACSKIDHQQKMRELEKLWKTRKKKQYQKLEEYPSWQLALDDYLEHMIRFEPIEAKSSVFS